MHENTPPLPPADLEECIALMQDGSKTFFAASRLLPQRVRSHAIALYAFCRVADDLVDHAEPGQTPLEALRLRLDAIYAGQPQPHVEDQALAMVVRETRLPRHLLDMLIEGFAWDAQGRVYETLRELHDYGARVAGSVGAMMCWIMGTRDHDTLMRACELGVAMQLTNICRDVGEDARMGRLYLPRQWLRQAGLNPEAWLAQPGACQAQRDVVAQLLDEADRLYAQALHGVASLPPDCRAAICAASLIYAEIGHQLRRNGLDSVSSRTVVSTSRKLVLLFMAWTQAGWIRVARLAPEPLEAVQGMVHACIESAGPQQGARLGYFPSRSMDQRVAWVLELLERRENLKRGQPLSGAG
jgi:15-cis-phytoene synthase